MAIPEVEIKFNPAVTPLEIWTNSSSGSNEELQVIFLSDLREEIGGVSIILTSPPRYMLYKCVESQTDFSTALPSDTSKIWTISLSRSYPDIQVTIFCNDNEALNVVLSDSICRSVSDWETYWLKDVTKIKFPSANSAGDYYRPPAYTSGRCCMRYCSVIDD